MYGLPLRRDRLTRVSRCLQRLALVCLLPTVLPAIDAVETASRLSATFDGIECSYAPGQESLARLLTARFKVHNDVINAAIAARKVAPPTPPVPLSPAELHAHRATYLAAISAQLGLAKPSPLQEECYDEFLRNYEFTIAAYDRMRSGMVDLQVIRRIVIWSREDLTHRLSAGEKIEGMSYDPVTKQGKMEYGFTTFGQDDELMKLGTARVDLHAQYRMSIETKDGQRTYRGGFGPKPKVPTSAPTTNAADHVGVDSPAQHRLVFPVIIRSEVADQPVEALAEELWNNPERGIAGLLRNMAETEQQFPDADPQLVFVVLHETTEIGIVEQYMRGPDRRWFCDGVANYVPWRVVRDLHGPQTADLVYNSSTQLAQFAAFRDQADLRKWPATESQTAEEQHTPLDAARYAFAAHAVFLMTSRAGEDVLPRLFTEIGKTNPNKVTIKTVDQAWKKISGTRLNDLLADAVKPAERDLTNEGR